MMNSRIMEEKNIGEVLRRIDRLEAVLEERHKQNKEEMTAIHKDLDRFEIRLRDVELTQAKLLAVVTGGGGIGGVIAGGILLAGKTLGWF